MTSRPLSSGRIGFFPKNLLPVTTHGSNCFYGSVGIDNPLVLKTDTQETENLDRAIFS
jgi:hypothetical protein